MRIPSLGAAARAIAARELSPLELTRACLDRVERYDRDVRTLEGPPAEDAEVLATQLTEELVRSGPRSPLHGIPVGVKDLIDVEGLPTRAGSRVLADAPPARRDADVVARLREAGAVILAKTTSHEFGFGVVTEPTRNPWDPDRIPGGSSGGSAASLAARFCLGALGTDTAGSVRIPAALCGVTGLKPRRGGVGMRGIVPLAPTLDVCGPLATDAAGVSLLWRSIRAAAGDAGAREPLGVGTVPAPSSVLACDPEIADAVDAAVQTLRAAGHRAVEVDPPPFGEWDRPCGLLLMAEALEVHRGSGWYPDRAAQYLPGTRGSFEYAARLRPDVLADARERLRDLISRWEAVLEEVDVLAIPTTPIVAPRADDRRDPREVMGDLIRLCQPANASGAAAVSVPCGFTDGLPIGLQLVARDEGTALRAAIEYQRGTDHHLREPPELPPLPATPPPSPTPS